MLFVSFYPFFGWGRWKQSEKSNRKCDSSCRRSELIPRSSSQKQQLSSCFSVAFLLSLSLSLWPLYPPSLCFLFLSVRSGPVAVFLV